MITRQSSWPSGYSLTNETGAEISFLYALGMWDTKEELFQEMVETFPEEDPEYLRKEFLDDAWYNATHNDFDPCMNWSGVDE